MLKKIIASCAPMIALYCISFVLDVGLGFYNRIPFFDVPMHALGGFTAAWTGLLLYNLVREQYAGVIIAPRALLYVYLIGFAAVVGIAWEWYEFLHDVFLNSAMQPSIADTMADFFFDIVGAILLCAIIAIRMRGKRLANAKNSLTPR